LHLHYEHENRGFFEYILNENQNAAQPMVLDVGGNIGYYTLLSAAWKHSVVTFEINPTNIMRICESLNFNSFQGQVKLHRRGVSDVTGQMLQIEVPTNPGAVGLLGASESQTSDNANKAQAKHFSVKTITLDDFATEKNWFKNKSLHLSIWKLDVEGLEATILMGSQKFIKAQLAKNILLEYRPGSAREAVNLLLDAGYVLVNNEKSTNTKRLLSRKESEDYLEGKTKWATENNNWKYSDLWFRLASLPFAN
jgi:FkbM family methyltransferase